MIIITAVQFSKGQSTHKAKHTTILQERKRFGSVPPYGGIRRGGQSVLTSLAGSWAVVVERIIKKKERKKGRERERKGEKERKKEREKRKEKRKGSGVNA
jgi:hypothetical protein